MTCLDDTSVHQALREALVNTLIHADYTGQVSILVVKRPDMFGFRNPGTMRMPVDAAVRGGLSDCRNRRLQAMFRYVGLGEQAGSGLPKIFASWRQQEWRAPDLVEEATPYEQTLFQLRMASLWPAETIAILDKRFGPAFAQLSETQKLALVTVAMEKSVTHARLAAMTDAHPRDVTVALYSLVQKGMLESSGQHKRSFYFLPGERPAVEPQLEFMLDAANGRGIEGGSQRIEGGSQRIEGGSQPTGTDGAGRPGLRAALPSALQELLASLGKRPRQARLRAAIERLCSWRALQPWELGEVLNVRPKNLVERHLAPMVSDGRLERSHPESPAHPAQAYRTPPRSLPEPRR